MDASQAVSIASKFAHQVVSEISPDEIILYGSFAKNCATELSDIDVAVIFDKFEGDELESSERLWQIAWDMEGYIEPVLLESRNDPSGFVSEVRKHGITLYQA